MSNYELVLIALLIVVMIAVGVQVKVITTYNKYLKKPSISNLTGFECAIKLINDHGLNDVMINEIGGHLTDNYNSKTKCVNISKINYNSHSVSALGIVAHELGHACQHKDKYIPFILRHLFIKVNNFMSKLLTPLVVVVILFSIFFLPELSIYAIAFLLIFYTLSFLINLITLPVEYNASRRGLKMLQESGIITSQEEIKIVKKILRYAALTYLVTVLMSLLELLRIIAFFSGDDD